MCVCVRVGVLLDWTRFKTLEFWDFLELGSSPVRSGCNPGLRLGMSGESSPCVRYVMASPSHGLGLGWALGQYLQVHG